MRRIGLVKMGRTTLVCLLCTVLLSGCIQGVFHAEIHWDGSVDTHLTVGLDQQAQRLLGDWNPLSELRAKVEEQGYITRAYDNTSYVGFTGTKQFRSMTELRSFLESFGNTLSPSNERTTNSRHEVQNEIQHSTAWKQRLPIQYSEESSFFYTTYALTGNIDVTSFIEKMTGNNFQSFSQLEENVGRYVVEQGDLRVKVTLPLELPLEHNATSVEDDGRTLVWRLTSPDDNPLRLSAKIPNVKAIAGTSVGSLVFIILFIRLMRRRRRAR